MRIKLATVVFLFTLLAPFVALAQPAAVTPDTMAAPMAAPVAADMAVSMDVQPMAAVPATMAATAAPMTPPAAPMAAPMAVAPMDPITAEFSMREPVADMTVAAMAPVVAPVPVPKSAPVASDAQSTDRDDFDDDQPGNQATSVAADASKVEEGKKPAAAPSTVKAADGKDPWWKALLGGLTSILLLFLSAVATGLGALLIKWVASKTKLSDAEGLVEAEKLYNAAVELGVNFAEQQAKKLAGDPDAKGKRIEWAVEKIQATIKDLGLAEKTTDWIRTRIEAKLGEQNRSKSSVSPPESPKAAEIKK